MAHDQSNGLDLVRAVYARARGPENGYVHDPADRPLLAGTLLAARVTPDQVRMIEQYLRTGELTATGGRGTGKTFALACIAALELAAGHTVLYRNSVGSGATDDFLRNLELVLGRPGVRAAQDRLRLWLNGRLWFNAHGTYGRVLHADLQDEPWTGGGFDGSGRDWCFRAARVARVGSMPERALRFESDARDNPFLPTDFRAAFATLYPPAETVVPAPTAAAPAPVVPPDEPGDADACYRVGPHGVESP